MKYKELDSNQQELVAVCFRDAIVEAGGLKAKIQPLIRVLKLANAEVTMGNDYVRIEKNNVLTTLMREYGEEIFL